ncbi:MAG: beta-propeller domain-containing protein [Acetobacter sp.]|nr:beta-propeller domain-containing protein [Bacteroides sp.]MCM1341061.1 beta-propeller domain-containing protein [Acetobacter sp.]MCM1432383.1 beta-propeller domain-containing protein [Clostridiales bacterium]
MKNNDFDFIKEKFDNDFISAPNTLDEKSARIMLENKVPLKIKLYQKKSFKAVASLAACFAVVLCCVLSVFQNDKVNLIPSDDAQSNLSYFSSYDDIKNAVDNNNNNFFEIAEYYYNNLKLSTTDTAKNISAQIGTGSSHAETYTQVEGIDEADIIKNDGKYIYHYSFCDNVIRIYEGNKTNPELVGKIDEFEGEGLICDYTSVGAETKRICDMYLINNRLVVNVTAGEWKDEEYCIGTTYSYIYDVTNASKPKKISSFSQSGDYISSRMIENKLYIVSSKEVYKTNDKDDYIPYTVADGGQKKYLSAKDICCPESTTENSFVIISSVDISTGKKSADSKAVFGAVTDVYCTNENMYIAVNRHGDEAEVDIIKVSIKDDDIKLKNSVTVNGSIDGQFSMDEYNGYFRIATTTERYKKRKNGEIYEIIRNNNLYVFNDKFNKIGEITGFAKDESIEAVKFMGDIAYVITFETTDPLFIIDLSNPSKPEIIGSVKIDGFSTQLLPIGDNKVLGIGFHEALVNEHEWETGIKLALFDVSDKSNPSVLDSYVLKYGNSEAQSNHKAIVINKEKGYFAIDYTQNLISEKGDDEEHAGAITFKIENNKIVVNNKFDYISDVKDEDYSPDASRCTYIDDIVYVLDMTGNIYAFEYED